MIFREYQEQGAAKVISLFESGVRRVLLVLPTGAGKTVVAAEIVRRCARRAVFLAHRRELVKQAFCKLVRGGLPVGEIGVVMSGVEWRVDRELGAVDPLSLTDDELWARWARRRPLAPTQVGSIDTFRNKVKLSAGLVLVDEAHRGLAKSYVDVQLAYPDAWHLGLTATPFRADGKGLSDAYDQIVVVASYAQLVTEGFLVAPKCWGSGVEADLSNVKKSSMGDYNEKELAVAVDKGELLGDIVDHWQRRGNNAATFCFAVGVEHSKHLRDRFLEAGIPAAHVDGNTDVRERDAAFRALRDGSIKVLCNCDVATEGTDVPCVKTIILARPTLSERIYLQQAGRGSRPFEGREFVILDHAGCTTNIEFGGPPHWPREYSLEGRKKKKREGSLPPAKKCPGCYCVVPIAMRACPDCGYEWPVEEEKVDPPKEKEGELVEITELNAPQILRLREWNKIVSGWRWENICRRARGEELREGKWCTGEWRRMKSDWPPKAAKIPKLTLEERAYNQSIQNEAKRKDDAYRRERTAAGRAINRMMGAG